MKCSIAISNFLEGLSSLSPSVVFFYFFALFTEEGLLISPCYSPELYIQLGNLSPSPLLFASFPASAICKASSDNHCAFLHFFFFGMILVATSYTMLWTSVHSSSDALFIRSNPLTLSLPLYNHKGFDLGQTWMAQWFFPSFFILSLNFTVRSWWAEPQSAPRLVFADDIELLHLRLKRIWSVWFRCWPFGDVRV